MYGANKRISNKEEQRRIVFFLYWVSASCCACNNEMSTIKHAETLLRTKDYCTHFKGELLQQ
jgi:hypothetical protein